MKGILLDTNVLSELTRLVPDANVMHWFRSQEKAIFYTSAVTRAEILLGVALLPPGKRRTGLAAAAEQMFAEEFAGRCLSFDEATATEYARLVAARTRLGRAISTEDGQIAAIAIVHRLPLATRNVKDFQYIDGLTLLNPWQP